MIDLKDKTVLILDFGNQIAVAQRLSRDFGTTLYWTPSVINGFEDHKAQDIGHGVEGIIRVKDWEDYKEQVDFFVFTDIYLNGLQESLKREGKYVFGSGKSAELEKDRIGFKELLKSLGLPVNEYDSAIGVSELMDKLKLVDDRYIKSHFRGSMETWHHTNYILSKMELKKLSHDMGIYDRKETYLIDTPIEAIAEVGYDGFCIDGFYPEISCTGIEIKDTGFIAKMVRYKDLPKQITESLDKLAPIFQSYGYRGAISTEVRVDKNKIGYFTDPTLRFPEPPTSLYMEMYENFSEIIVDVSMGIVPKIKYKYEYGIELIIKSESAKTEPVAIQFPKEYTNFIKIKNLVVDEDGTHWYNPNNIEISEIGAVIGLGKTLDQAIKMATDVAKTVKGFDLKINTDCIEQAKQQIYNLNKNGIKYL